MNNDKTKKTIIIIVAIVLVLGVIAWLIMTIIPAAIIATAQEQSINDAEDAVKKHEIAEIKSFVSLEYAKNIFNEQGEKPTPKELEQAMNNALLLEYGPEYTVTISEDYQITYNFEIEEN